MFFFSLTRVPFVFRNILGVSGVLLEHLLTSRNMAQNTDHWNNIKKMIQLHIDAQNELNNVVSGGIMVFSTLMAVNSI